LTVTLLAALFLEAAAVILLRHRLGRYWLRHPVTLVVLASAVYQGLSPALLAIPSIGAWDNFRIGIQPGFADNAALLTSAGMLAFTVAYLATRPGQAIRTADPAAVRAAAIVLDWRWLTAACVPLAVLTYQGRGYNGAVTIAGSATPLGSDLAGTFFIVLTVLASFSFLLKYSTRWFIPVLIAQSVVLAAAGERTPVTTDAIALVIMLAAAGFRPRPRQLCGAAVIALAAVLAITGLRAHQGRSLFSGDSGISARLSALGDGVASFTGPTAAGLSAPSLLTQAVVRLDGTAFTAGILQAVHSGQPRFSPAYVPDSLLLTVPSSAWSSKLAHASALNPDSLETGGFGLQQVNFLPTLPGLYAGFLSAPWLVLFLAFLGLLCGWGERWLFRRCTPARFVLLAGAVIAALVYEAGLPAMLVQLRAAAAIAVVVKVTGLARGWSTSPGPRSRGRTSPAAGGLPVGPDRPGQRAALRAE
jgi:hypothetical protein